MIWLSIGLALATSAGTSPVHSVWPASSGFSSDYRSSTGQGDTLWTPLFNGTDLSGWKHVGRGRFVVENGLLRTEGGMGLLWYTGRTFEDVVLRIVYRNPGADNSGVFIRMPRPPTGAWGPQHGGYEVQIDDSDDEFHVTGVLYSFTRAMARPTKPDEWNTMDITLDGHRTVVAINGVVVTDYTEGQPKRRRPWWEFWKFWAPEPGPWPDSGYIGLQNHSGDDTVYFREVSFRAIEQGNDAGRAVDSIPDGTSP